MQFNIESKCYPELRTHGGVYLKQRHGSDKHDSGSYLMCEGEAVLTPARQSEAEKYALGCKHCKTVESSLRPVLNTYI